MGKAATGEGFAAAVASDSLDLPTRNGKFPRCIRFGTGGTCTMVAPDGSEAVFTNIQNGETITSDVKRIKATGLTGCADMVAIY